MRPLCPVCKQRPCAVNYRRNDVTHYRGKCETCLRRSKNMPPRQPRWKGSGYQKKSSCDRCGFRARYVNQLIVYHVDGNLNHTAMRNLRTICKNCVEEVARVEITWRPGDLEPDTDIC